ncbi:MAG TPA: barstar family protein [Burkholderiaceae bacterium]|nr:barstar family protein [Burkholderiaceae bacterium]
MTTAPSLFARIAPQSVQPLRGMTEDDVRVAARDAGDHFRAIDCASCTCRADVFAQLALGLGLPPHFGGNLDALYDSLTDLPHSPSRGWTIVIHHVPLLRDFDQEEREALMDVFRDAAEFYAEEGGAFRVFFTLG